ncbi:hypothetical protein [Klebsiella variicola]|uniref:hypothetical protein n=1 Tax=Klebsiella variicola TaxID=244366 RepID=UPI0035BE5C52
MFHVVPRQNIRMLVVFVRWQPTDVPTTSRRTLPSWRLVLPDRQPAGGPMRYIPKASRFSVKAKLAVSRRFHNRPSTRS